MQHTSKTKRPFSHYFFIVTGIVFGLILAFNGMSLFGIILYGGIVPFAFYFLLANRNCEVIVTEESLTVHYLIPFYSDYTFALNEILFVQYVPVSIAFGDSYSSWRERKDKLEIKTTTDEYSLLINTDEEDLIILIDLVNTKSQRQGKASMAEELGIPEHVFDTVFPDGALWVEEEVKEISTLLNNQYSKELIKSTFVKGAIQFAMSEDKSEKKIIEHIIKLSGHGFSNESAKILHDYLYSRAIRYMVGKDEKTFAIVNDIEDLNGYDMDEIPEGTGEFGLQATNPIPVKGIISIETYLKRLRTQDGKKAKWERVGSQAVENIINPIDIYTLLSEDGRKLPSLYFSPYHKRISNKAPKGYTLVSRKAVPQI
jgi:hypothetical protein